MEGFTNTLRGMIKAIKDKLGSTNISTIGDGTVTGAISTINSNLSVNYANVTNVIAPSRADVFNVRYSKYVAEISLWNVTWSAAHTNDEVIAKVTMAKPYTNVIIRLCTASGTSGDPQLWIDSSGNIHANRIAANALYYGYQSYIKS